MKVTEVLISDPVVVQREGAAVIFVSRADAAKSRTDILVHAQLYDEDRGVFSPVLPLGSFAKFLSQIEIVDPPQPFVRPM